MTSIPNTQTIPAAPYDAKAAAIEVARLLSDDRCTDVTLLDVRGISSVQDFVVLASGTSDRQMRSAASDIKNLLPKLGSSVYRTSIDDQSTWIVVDCVDTVVHIFEPNTRSYYDLESMWGDAPKIEWLRPGQKPFTVGDEMDEPAPSRSAAVNDRADEGDTDEPAPARTESSEPDADADIELTTGTAEAFAEEARASVAPKPKSQGKAKTAPAKSKAKPAPKAKTATKTAKKAPAKKAAAKKPAPAAKKAAKKPAAKSAKKTAPAKKPAAKKATKKAAKKR